MVRTCPPAKTRYLGLDLAWSERARSGVCALDAAGRVLDEDQLSRPELASWLMRWRGERSLIAVDAPLVVPAGSPALRPVERELHRRYGGFHAGPFPGGAASTAMRGLARSPAAALLDDVGGYTVDPTDRRSSHRAIEVFPAPTWLELFALPERVVYKRGRLAARVAGLNRLRGLLASLASAAMPLVDSTPSMLDNLVGVAVSARQWKAIEDIVDARLCAYTAAMWDRLGEDSWLITGGGDWGAGYIVVPQIRHDSS